MARTGGPPDGQIEDQACQAQRQRIKDSTRAEVVEARQRPGGKLGLIVDRLAATAGATADELAEATGWQKHTVLGALSRLRARGFAMQLETEGGRKAYRLDLAEG